METDKEKLMKEVMERVLINFDSQTRSFNVTVKNVSGKPCSSRIPHPKGPGETDWRVLDMGDGMACSLGIESFEKSITLTAYPMSCDDDGCFTTMTDCPAKKWNFYR